MNWCDLTDKQKEKFYVYYTTLGLHAYYFYQSSEPTIYNQQGLEVDINKLLNKWLRMQREKKLNRI
jgi:hypothetical protein